MLTDGPMQSERSGHDQVRRRVAEAGREEYASATDGCVQRACLRTRSMISERMGYEQRSRACLSNITTAKLSSWILACVIHVGCAVSPVCPPMVSIASEQVYSVA